MVVEVDAARRLLSEGQGTRVTELLESSGPPDQVADAYHRVAKDLYWKDKDLPSARSALALGIAYAVDQARSTTDPEIAMDLTGRAKAMCYDLASFCWPGWDEPGIPIGEAEIECGEHAASENLRLAIELQRGDAPMANAHFMVGAYHLALKRYAYAEASFEQFRSFAEKTGDTGMLLTSLGYLALARELDGTPSELDTAISNLRAEGIEHGQFFADQLVTAREVFSNRVTV